MDRTEASLKDSKKAILVTVIGSAACNDQVAGLAREVGREIARRGAVLICGGRGGVMEAACQGARAEGGLTVGILPGNDRYDANPYVDVPIATGLGEARNAVVVSAADVIIAVSGGYGTLSEIALALKMGRPVVGLHTWGFSQESQALDPIIRAETSAEAVELAVEQVQGKSAWEMKDG
jgi:uncharacterized protein (TIGR00725 family)